MLITRRVATGLLLVPMSGMRFAAAAPAAAGASDLRPGQRHLSDGRRRDAGRQAPRRVPQARRRGEGRARAGCCLRRQRDLRPCRRHALSLLDVEPRPGRQHRDADQHGRGPTSSRPATTNTISARRCFSSAWRAATFPRYGANLRNADGATLPDFQDRSMVTVGGVRIGLTGATYEDSPRASDPGDLKFSCLGRDADRAGQDAQARGRRLRRRGRACHPRAGLRALSQRHDRSHPHRPHPRSLHQL